MPDRDSIRRFLFEHSPVRGHLVHLDSAWLAMCEHHSYPDAVRTVLGEAAAAAVLVASTRKFDGTLSVQLQGPGPMHLLVAQCTQDFGVRGVARISGEVTDNSLASLAGDGRLTVTVENNDGSGRYEGVVPLVQGDLASCFEAYFRDSEQLPTRIWLSATPTEAVGMLLQRLPQVSRHPAVQPREEEDPVEAWNRLEHLAATLEREELIALPHRDLIRRLFHEEDVRLFEPAPVFFRCRCSRERVAGLLRSLGSAEVRGILDEFGHIEVRCEFCNRTYRFDAVDAEELLRAPGEAVHASTLQ